MEVSSGQEETSVENAASEIAEGDREKTVELPPETTDGAATSKAEEDQNKAVEGDSTSQAMQCDLCPSKFDKWSSLYIHRCTHTGEEPAIQCSVCNEHFNSIEGNLTKCTFNLTPLSEKLCISKCSC